MTLPDFLDAHVVHELGGMSVHDAVRTGETHADLLELVESTLRDMPAVFVARLSRLRRKRLLVRAYRGRRLGRGPYALRSRLTRRARVTRRISSSLGRHAWWGPGPWRRSSRRRMPHRRPRQRHRHCSPQPQHRRLPRCSARLPSTPAETTCGRGHRKMAQPLGGAARSVAPQRRQLPNSSLRRTRQRLPLRLKLLHRLHLRRQLLRRPRRRQVGQLLYRRRKRLCQRPSTSPPRWLRLPTLLRRRRGASSRHTHRRCAMHALPRRR